MGLLIDDIREHGVVADPFTEIYFDHDSVKAIIDRIATDERVQKFDVTPVGTKFLQGELHLADLPGFRLPFAACWFEIHEKIDPTSPLATTNQTLSAATLAWGMYCEEMTRSAYERTEFASLTGFPDQTFYVQVGTLFCAFGQTGHGNLPSGPVASWLVPLDEQGRFITGVTASGGAMAIQLVPMSQTIVEYCREAGFVEEQQIQSFLTTNYVMPLYCGVGLLNIRNITTEVITREPKIQAARIKRKKPPFVSYHTLVVRPLSAGRRTVREGGSPLTGHTMPFHTVRGHPVTYHEDAPRFGRASDGVGTFWIEGHARGLRSSGETKKDYEVEPTEDRKTRTRAVPRSASYRGPELWRELVTARPSPETERPATSQPENGHADPSVPARRRARKRKRRP